MKQSAEADLACLPHLCTMPALTARLCPLWLSLLQSAVSCRALALDLRTYLCGPDPASPLGVSACCTCCLLLRLPHFCCCCHVTWHMVHVTRQCVDLMSFPTSAPSKLHRPWNPLLSNTVQLKSTSTFYPLCCINICLLHWLEPHAKLDAS